MEFEVSVMQLLESVSNISMSKVSRLKGAFTHKLRVSQKGIESMSPIRSIVASPFRAFPPLHTFPLPLGNQSNYEGNFYAVTFTIFHFSFAFPKYITDKHLPAIFSNIRPIPFTTDMLSYAQVVY